jgi:hypothetical protein
MLRVYAASTAGAVEADLDAIRYAMATGAGVARYVPAGSGIIWRRERDSNRIQTNNRINKLLIPKTTRSPRIPVSPHSCLQDRLQESLSFALNPACHSTLPCLTRASIEVEEQGLLHRPGPSTLLPSRILAISRSQASVPFAPQCARLQPDTTQTDLAGFGPIADGSVRLPFRALQLVSMGLGWIDYVAIRRPD